MTISRNGVGSTALLISLGLFVIVGSAAWVFADAASYGFLDGDDQRHIYDNPYVKALTWKNLLWMFSTAEVDYWRPLSFVSHAIDYTVWGEDIGAHHVTNLAIHTINALLVATIAFTVLQLRSLTLSTNSALFGGLLAGLLFVVHPQNVETAVWLSERKGVLVSMFYLAALGAYLRAKGESARWNFIALCCAILAMMSKPMAVSLPLALLMLDIYPLERLRWQQSWRTWVTLGLEKLPYVLLAVGVSLYTVLAVDTGGYLNSAEVLSTSDRLINAARSVWIYIGRWFVPLGLSPLYPLQIVDNSINWLNLMAPLAIVVVSITGLVLWMRGQALVLGIFGLHMALLSPVLGLVHVGIQSSADRYAYLPDAWIATLVAAATVGLWLKLQDSPVLRGALVLVMCAWLVGTATFARQQVSVWESKQHHNAVIAHLFPSWRANGFFRDGFSAYQDGDYGVAAGYFEAAVAHKQLKARSHMFLASSFQKLGHHGLALEQANLALMAKPSSLLLLQMAIDIRVVAGEFESARAAVTQLSHYAAQDPGVKRYAALIEMQAGQLRRAREFILEAMSMAPDDLDTLVLSGVLAMRQGKLEAARIAFERVLQLAPDNTDALQNLRTLNEVDTPK